MSTEDVAAELGISGRRVQQIVREFNEGAFESAPDSSTSEGDAPDTTGGDGSIVAEELRGAA